MKKISIAFVCAYVMIISVVQFPFHGTAQNVGIGTTSPAFKLDVQGRIRIKAGTLGNVNTSSGIWFDDYRDGSNQFFFGMRDSIQAGFYSSVLSWDLFYNIKTGNLGLGMLNPAYKLTVNGLTGIYSNDVFVGSLGAVGTNFLINAKLGNLIASIEPENLILQQTTLLGASSGRVGIGTSMPDTKLQVEGGGDVTVSSGGYLQLGSTSGANVGFDPNEIQARNNGAAGKLFIQSNGGDLQIGGTNNIIINDGYQVYRNRPFSTNADLIPIAYARVSSSGTLLSGTSNFTVTKPDVGEYRLFLAGENNIFANSGLYTIVVTPMGPGLVSPKYFGVAIKNDDAIWVQFARPRINYTNSTVDGQTCSLISGDVYPYLEDTSFCIVVYKQ